MNIPVANSNLWSEKAVKIRMFKVGKVTVSRCSWMEISTRTNGYLKINEMCHNSTFA